MAAGAGCLMRLVSGNDVLEHLTFTDNILETIGRVPREHLRLINIAYAGTFSAGYAEISAPNAVFDGVATPIIVYAISASANDTNVGGAGHAEKVTIIGLDENNDIITETINLAGASQVAGTVKWQRLFHAYVSEWGSGGDDAAGAITITNTGQVATYLTIAISKNESDGAAVFMAAGMKAILEHISLTMTSSANANAAILVKASAININGMGADPDYLYNEWRTVISSGGIHETHTEIREAQLGAKITFSETFKGAAEDGLLNLHVLIWE